MTRSPLGVHWPLDPAVTFLNHGSFGATPTPVLQAQAEWRTRMEREPVRFHARDLERHLDEARARLASFLLADADDLAFLPNATTGINTVLRSLDLRPTDEILTTDHEYNACLNAVGAVAAAARARVVVARVPFPIPSAGEVVESILAAVSDATRLAVLSHVTSPTALVWPIDRLVAALAERGVDTLVDGAHGPGMVPLQLDALGAAYYAGNCHKWLCAPKGSGFLHVRRDRQAAIRPLVVSHGANSPRTDRARFRLEFDWLGTVDPTPYLATPAAIDFVGSLVPGGWPGVMAANRALILEGLNVVRAALGGPPPAPPEMLGSMASLPVPADLPPPAPGMPHDAPAGATFPPDPLRDILHDRFSIEVPVSAWPPIQQSTRPRLRLMRLSAQLYNSSSDYDRLAAALVDLRGSRAAGGP